jgi:2-iminobutanoate/2-iminopropanoate deaminase
MKKQAIWPEKGPKPVGPYSPAVCYGDLVFVSGQGPMDPETGEIKLGDILEEFSLAVRNVGILLEEAGSSLENALKVTLYLADMDDFSAVNEAYKEHFGPVFPARTTIQAARLPKGIKVEIDVIACKS